MMKKTLVALAMAGVLTLRMNAIPAYPYPVAVTQPDGTSVELMLLGDENQGLALVNPQFFLAFAEAMRHGKD